MTEEKPLYPFTYYGSQYRSLDFILERLPHSDCYIEPFAGSAVVLLNRRESGHEVLNDLNGNIINFFQILREKPEKFVQSLELTPYSRSEFEKAVERRGNPNLTDLERARLFYIRIQQGRYSAINSDRNKGAWARSTNQIRNGNPLQVNRWINKVEGLESVVQRLREVQIENRPANDVMEDYDNENALHYLDPPYVPESRSGGSAYGEFEFGRSDHREMLSVVQSLSGDVALSGYDNDLYEKVLNDWFVSRAEEKTNQNGGTGESGDNSSTQEVLWTNYDPQSVNQVNHDSALDY